MRLKTLFKFFFIFFIFAFIAGFISFIVFGVDSSPRISSSNKLSVKDIDRAKALIKKHNPKKLKEGEIKQLKITQRDLNIILSYTLDYFPRVNRIRSRIDLFPNSAELSFTLHLPANPIGSYINMSATLSDFSKKAVIQKITIGQIVIKGWLLKPVIFFVNRLKKRLKAIPEIVDVAKFIKNFQFQKKELVLTYQWRSEVVKRLKQKGQKMLIPDEERRLFLAYNEKLVSVSKNLIGKKISLGQLLVPLFDHAEKRTALKGDPVAENRAIIVLLTLYVNGKTVKVLLGANEGEKIPKPRKMRVTLRNRRDLAQHFMVSAAIAAIADSELANISGLFKEIDDSKGGTGFSFADLAADRAGVRFAELSTGSPKGAIFVQKHLNKDLTESNFMPRIDRLPEGIQEMTFKKRYRDMDSKEFLKVKNEIKHRIAACQLYQ